MASHGVPRSASRQQRTEEARQKEIKEIESYRELVNFVQKKVNSKDFSPELLEKTGALLQRNPEYYTIWNIRRRIYSNEFDSIRAAEASAEISSESRLSQTLDIIQLDLQFLFPLLLKFPKCYWIWNHRIWLLQQSSILLPTATARKIWEEELALVAKMLTRDSRNYHGWSYRRFIIDNLEGSELQGSSMARSEYDYTTKMIGNNLSNFSAWHNRSRLILRILEEENATPDDRRGMLDKELDLIHKALFDPYDQSLWFYHESLMNVFDPHRCHGTMAPALSAEDKLQYVKQEKDFIREVLEDADDCKWVYQALIESTLIEEKLGAGLSEEAKNELRNWLVKLKQLDPLRAGRWTDLETQLA